ncbi:G-type lectin S-receptor-like serine/threonine-protein kinase At1g61480 [Cannabis sativa]|uniref:G-type lectin S-receptor-like serine/threonine-protein kinase At1g61480 n=1 Tax=Cannabis sativa TaxID=3483 RepID=UPI0029CA6592|nr:G-type lectin S-receptor-like serine/threonine-protein kinase At1g61480 [Cannabis sativa]
MASLDPTLVQAAMKDQKWSGAMDNKFTTLICNQIWTLVHLNGWIELRMRSFSRELCMCRNLLCIGILELLLLSFPLRLLLSLSYSAFSNLKSLSTSSFFDSVRRRSSILQWNLDVATQLVVASDEDGSPALRLWDMRNIMSPVREFVGHTKDGKVVAVKGLFFNTRQWVDHFFNEVNLISGIPHKNLVELLGCNIIGPESLLLWESRYKIILGVAEGLAYLHEESNLRIIHRDIKLNNIMLDEDLTR